MVVDPPTPLPLRPSDAERERTVRTLRDRSAEGRLSFDTFSHRVERAYQARNRDELDELVADVPTGSVLGRTLAGLTTRLSGLTAGLEAAWREPRTPRLGLPSRAGAALVIGRAAECDCVLPDSTVSRRHASIRRRGETWLLRDLGSTNGTRVNGWRLVEEVEVHPGDRVTFGGVRYRLTEPA